MSERLVRVVKFDKGVVLTVQGGLAPANTTVQAVGGATATGRRIRMTKGVSYRIQDLGYEGQASDNLVVLQDGGDLLVFVGPSKFYRFEAYAQVCEAGECGVVLPEGLQASAHGSGAVLYHAGDAPWVRSGMLDGGASLFQMAAMTAEPAAAVSPWGALAGVGLLAGLGAGAGSGGASAQGPASGSQVTVSGLISAGPVTRIDGLEVEIYTADGRRLERVAVQEGGRFTATVAARPGEVLIAKLIDKDNAPDFLDEATGEQTDIDAVMLAAFAVGAADSVAVALNPLTTVAARMAGVSVSAAGLVVNEVSPDRVKAANMTVARAAGVEQEIALVQAAPTNGAGFSSADGLSAAEKVGVMLAAISGVARTKGQQAAIDVLAGDQTLASTGGFANESMLLLINGALLANDKAVASGQTALLDMMKEQVQPAARAQIADIVAAEPAPTAEKILSAPGAITALQASKITPSTAAALAPEVLATMGSNLSVLPAATVAALPTATVAALPASALAQMGANLAELPAATVTALPAATVAALPAAALAQMAENLAELPAAAVAALPVATVAALPAATLAQMAENLAQLPAATVAALPTVTVGTLPGEALALLELSAITPTQASAITAAQTAALGSEAVRELTPTALASLSPATLASVTLTQLSQLTGEQLLNLGNPTISQPTTATTYFIQPLTQVRDAIYRVQEGDTVTVVVSRTGDVSAAGTVDIMGSGRALIGTDYSLSATQVSFAAGQTSRQVTLTVLADGAVEGSETFSLALANPSAGAGVGPAASLSIGASGVTTWSLGSTLRAIGEGGQLVVDVFRNNGAGAATVALNLSGTGNAADFSVEGGSTLSFADGETSKTVKVNIADDATPQPNRTLSISLANPSVGIADDSVRSVTVLDNEQSVWQVSASRVSEGAGFLTFVVTRTGAAQSATIDFRTVEGTATPGVDYTTVSETLTFAAGETRKTVQVPIVDDALAETNEIIIGRLLNPSAGTVEAQSVTATILDNEAAIWSVSAAEANEGAGHMAFTVSRTGASTAATVRFTTAGGTATRGVDYTATEEVLTFADGEMSKTVLVPLMEDTQAETNETVGAAIMDLSTGTALSGSTTGNLLDNDQSVWSVSAATVDEGAGVLAFTVSRTGASGAATIDFATAGGTALRGVDFTATNATLSFAAGEMSKTVLLPITDDNLPESNETVIGVITNASTGTLLTASATGTLQDNDQSVWSMVAAANPVENSGAVVFTVQRTGATGAAAIDFVVAGGTAANGTDYTALKTRLSFAAGEMRKMIAVPLVNNDTPEGAETITAALANPSSGIVPTPTFIRSLQDDDQSAWSVTSGAADEGAGFLVFTVSRTGALGAATIDFATSDLTASAGADYTAATSTLSFAAGEVSKTVLVALNDDDRPEVNETVLGRIALPSSGVLVAASASATIQDNDQSVWALSAATLSEDGDAMVFTVSRTGALGAATIGFATVAGTAVAGTDYTAVNTSLSFAAGESSKTVRVPVLNDSVVEANETIVGVLFNASVGALPSTGGNFSTISSDELARTSFAVSAPLSAVAKSDRVVIYTITRSGDVSGTQTIDYVVAGTSTAAAGVDYAGLVGGVGTVTFGPEQRQHMVVIDLLGDTAASSKTLALALRNASAGVITTAEATVTLEQVPTPSYTISAAASSLSETAGTAYFTITRAGNISAESVSYFRRSGGTATAGTDFTDPGTLTLNWASGETVKMVGIDLLNDSNAETQSETLIGQVSSNADFSAPASTSTVTIFDDDSTYYSIEVVAGLDFLPTESVGTVAFMIRRTGDLSSQTTNYFRVQPGTGAVAGTDYQDPGSMTLTWAPFESVKVVPVQLISNDVTGAQAKTLTGQISADSGFSSVSSAAREFLDDDLRTGTSGNDSFQTTLHGYRFSTGGGNDTVWRDLPMRTFTEFDLGEGNDTLDAGITPASLIVAGARYLGGAGFDQIYLRGTNTVWNFTGTERPNLLASGFETIDLAVDTNKQTVTLSLQDVLEFTTGNQVANTLRIFGGATDVLNLQAAGKTLLTPDAGTQLPDETGTNRTVAASTAGNASANDVTVGAKTYDVYQFNHAGQLLTILVDTAMTTTIL